MPKPQPRTKRLWKRLAQSYGTRFTETYGEEPNESWTEALEEISDEQLEHGLRVILRESPIHPPPLGQFVQACLNMPIAQQKHIASIQEQLCEYAAIKFHGRISRSEFSSPWTYLYREWWDAGRPKGMEKCAECTGVVIECENDTRFKITVAEMQADTEGYQRMLRAFRPGPLPAAPFTKSYPEGVPA